MSVRGDSASTMQASQPTCCALPILVAERPVSVETLATTSMMSTTKQSPARFRLPPQFQAATSDKRDDSLKGAFPKVPVKVDPVTGDLSRQEERNSQEQTQMQHSLAHQNSPLSSWISAQPGRTGPSWRRHFVTGADGAVKASKPATGYPLKNDPVEFLKTAAFNEERSLHGQGGLGQPWSRDINHPQGISVLAIPAARKSPQPATAASTSIYHGARLSDIIPMAAMGHQRNEKREFVESTVQHRRMIQPPFAAQPNVLRYGGRFATPAAPAEATQGNGFGHYRSDMEAAAMSSGSERLVLGAKPFDSQQRHQAEAIDRPFVSSSTRGHHHTRFQSPNRCIRLSHNLARPHVHVGPYMASRPQLRDDVQWPRHSVVGSAHASHHRYVHPAGAGHYSTEKEIGKWQAAQAQGQRFSSLPLPYEKRKPPTAPIPSEQAEMNMAQPTKRPAVDALPEPVFKKAKGFDKLDLLCSATLDIGELHDNPTGCSCPKSKCVALYCDCFKAGRRCDPKNCSCADCKNTIAESGIDGARTKAIRCILARNPRAFNTAGIGNPTLKLPPGEIACNCVRSKCLKLYCSCFHNGKTCKPDVCTCVGCQNTEADIDGHRKAAIQQAIEKRADAFVVKQKEKGMGCACKNNRCVRKYCECFRTGLGCTDKCTCRECENRPFTRV